MNILIVTPYFYPENFRVIDFTEEFTKRVHEITDLTGEPDYPEGKFYDGYEIFSGPKKYTMA